MGKRDRLRKEAIRAGTGVSFKDRQDVLNCAHCGMSLRIPRNRTVDSSETYLRIIVPQHTAGCRIRNCWKEREYATT